MLRQTQELSHSNSWWWHPVTPIPAYGIVLLLFITREKSTIRPAELQIAHVNWSFCETGPGQQWETWKMNTFSLGSGVFWKWAGSYGKGKLETGPLMKIWDTLKQGETAQDNTCHRAGDTGSLTSPLCTTSTTSCMGPRKPKSSGTFLKFKQLTAHMLQHRTFNLSGISWHVTTRSCSFCLDIQKA